MSKIYTLNLTKDELWALSENYTAAFTDPDNRDAVEVKVSEKLLRLSQRAHRDATSASLQDRGQP